jgi:hypothetical protein
VTRRHGQAAFSVQTQRRCTLKHLILDSWSIHTQFGYFSHLIALFCTVSGIHTPARGFSSFFQ